MNIYVDYYYPLCESYILTFQVLSTDIWIRRDDLILQRLFNRPSFFAYSMQLIFNRSHFQILILKQLGHTERAKIKAH